MPSVRQLWTYGETGFHSLAAAIVRERYTREALVAGFRILGEGQLALTKFLMDLSDARLTKFGFKITTAWDLRRAEQLLAPAAPTRTGIGVDVHAVDAERPLRLGPFAQRSQHRAARFLVALADVEDHTPRV